jgi:site-specific recombinase XerD
MFFLYDTGVRAAELGGITLSDVDLEGRQVRVLGKGNKQRFVPIGAKCQKAVWKYQQFFRPEPATPNISQLFLTDEGYPLRVDCLQDIVKRSANRAGISGIQVSPHAFRRTFAVNYLKNGGDIFTLKEILGHTTLAMMRVYIMLAQTDVAEVHRRCSPGDNLDLNEFKRPGALNRKSTGR